MIKLLKSMHFEKAGFTLIELMVSISIVSMLSSVVFAAVSGARDKAKTTGAIIFSDNMYKTWGADALGIWNFNEPTGSDALDNGAYNITLTHAGSSGPWARSSDSPLANNSSLDFTSSGMTTGVNYFDSGDLSSRGISLSQGYTASFWIKLTGLASGAPFFVTNTGGVFVYRFAFINFVNTGTSFWVGPSFGSTAAGTQVNYTTPLNKWVHFAIAYSPISGTNRLYIDGKLFTSYSVSNSNTIIKQIYVGTMDANNSHFNNGKMDELAIYGSVLTASEIERIYANGLSRHNLAVKP